MLHNVFNLDQWNRLPKHYQAIVSNACEAANNWMLAKYDAVNPPALRRLVQQGCELRAFPPPSWKPATRLLRAVQRDRGNQCQLQAGTGQHDRHPRRPARVVADCRIFL